MQPASGCLVLNKISVTAWVVGTAKKMREAPTDDVSDWRRCWVATYAELGGRSKTSGSKGCPLTAAHGLWFLGRLKEGDRARRKWDVGEVDRNLGKNAAYATIAADLLEQGASDDVDELWKAVRERYKALARIMHGCLVLSK